MKQIKLFTILLAAAALTATGCKKDSDSNLASVDELQFYESFFTMQVGDSYAVDYLVKPANPKGKLKWKSDSPDVVEVKDGMLTAKGEGEARIRLIAKNTETRTLVTVIPKRYELCQMKLNSSNKGYKNVLGDDIVLDVDSENHYFVLWDNETGNYVQGSDLKTKLEGKFKDSEAAKAFYPLKTEWGIYDYYGILVVPRRFCEKTQLDIIYDVEPLCSIHFTVNIKSYYRRKFYLVNYVSHEILPTLNDISSSNLPVIARKSWGKESAPEEIKDHTGINYIHIGDDSNLTITYSPENRFYYTVAKNGSVDITKSREIRFGYQNGDESFTQPLFFTTHAVRYYELPDVVYDR